VSDLVFMGAPGSGKGTQARLLVDAGGYVQLATGDLFRDHLRNATELGRLAQSYMSRGEYVPDDVTVRMVRQRIGELDARTRVVFDGFPRTVAQAEALDGLLGERGRRLGAVLLFEVSRERLLERLGGRATCGNCQQMYSLAIRPPKKPGVCDRCGGPVVTTARDDDSPEVVRRRLEVYEEQTKPVVEHYERCGVLRRLQGEGSIEDISARVRAAIAEADRRAGPSGAAA
jgi:adenylate kinase